MSLASATTATNGRGPAAIAALKEAARDAPALHAAPPAVAGGAAAALACSPVEAARLRYTPRLPPVLRGPFVLAAGGATAPAEGAADGASGTVRALFPHLYGQSAVRIVPHAGSGTVDAGRRLVIGVVLSGGPAPGGHNVLCGLHDFLAARNLSSRLLGFLAGPSGIVNAEYVELDAQAVAPYRNQGGFHMIGSGRTKIETEDQFAAARSTVKKLGLSGLVVVGGDDSNSNAMKLAEDFAAHRISCCVIGVPKTIDADMRGDQIEMSFGFDTAAKIYANLIANLGQDAVSARKSYFFCRVMGRSASHVALECALQVRANLTLIGEEIAENATTLPKVVGIIADLVCDRAALGKNYGLIIIPEGLVEFMPDVKRLISELNDILAEKKAHTYDSCRANLDPQSRDLFDLLPTSYAEQLMLERDPHGNVQVAKIEVERLLIEMVGAELQQRMVSGAYKGKFSASPHYLGYEGRCGLPSNFDANYCYSLGHVAAALVEAKCTGYVATLSGLTREPEEWEPAGYPLTMMMNIERRDGNDVAVIKKKLIDLKDTPFGIFKAHRDSWRLSDNFRNPGPIQYSGPGSDDVTITMIAEAEGV
jgi:diphosphate-dependent phosphofructokinase